MIDKEGKEDLFEADKAPHVSHRGHGFAMLHRQAWAAVTGGTVLAAMQTIYLLSNLTCPASLPPEVIPGMEFVISQDQGHKDAGDDNVPQAQHGEGHCRAALLKCPWEQQLDRGIKGFGLHCQCLQ